jgi:hypothetical protein
MLLRELTARRGCVRAQGSMQAPLYFLLRRPNPTCDLFCGLYFFSALKQTSYRKLVAHGAGMEITTDSVTYGFPCCNLAILSHMLLSQY